MLEGAKGTRWDGRSVDAHGVAVVEPDTAVAVGFHDHATCAFVSTGPTSCVGVLDELPDMACEPGGTVLVRRSSAEAHRRVSAVIQAAEHIGRSTPSPLFHDEARCSLRASLIEAIRKLFAPAKKIAATKRGANRHRVVRRADEYLCANPIRPIYTEELCEMLGVSPTALHEAFRAVFGISPHRYLKLRRMSLVRTTLLSRSSACGSVKAAALSHGFWHLGQFSHDYQAIYGELPSVTLARGRGEQRPIS
jgi:AraC family ethanolamine operon transcriptional activator